MKINAKIAVAGSGEVENSLEKSKPRRCLIRRALVQTQAEREFSWAPLA